jgi:hypothetical protein
LIGRSRTRRPLRRAILATMALAAGGILAVLPITPADATPPESPAVTYRHGSPSGFPTLHMMLLNDTGAPIDTWRIDFDLPAGTWPAFWISGEYVIHTTAFADQPNHATVTPPRLAPDGKPPRPLQPGAAIFIDVLMHGDGLISNCAVDGADPCVLVNS